MSTNTLHPGVYSHLPIQQYHAADGYSSSQIRRILESPLAFKAEYIDALIKDLTKWGQTNRAMCIGGAVASLMDSRSVFDNGYQVLGHKVSKLNKNTTEFKQAFAQATIDHPEKTVILTQEYEQAQAIVHAIHHHPDPATRQQLEVLFDDPGLDSEISYVHVDPETGLKVKTRPDLSLRGLLADVKTTTCSCAPWEYAKRVLNSGLHIQAAMGLDIVNAVKGTDIINWLLIVMEQSPPHDVAVYYLEEPTLELGRSEYRRGLRLLADCLETDTWPGKVAGIQPISVPAYAFKQEEI